MANYRKVSDEKGDLAIVLELIESLEPFVDQFGSFWGTIAPATGAAVVVPLEGQEIDDWLLAQGFDEGFVPDGKTIRKAIAICRSRLRSALPTSNTDPPIVRLIFKLTETYPSWQGSATEASRLLEQTEREYHLLRSSEILPHRPEALAAQLAKAVLPLRAHGISLYRPRRRDTKRLWAWEKALQWGTADGPDTNRQDVITASVNGTDDTITPSASTDRNDSLTAEQCRLKSILEGDADA